LLLDAFCPAGEADIESSDLIVVAEDLQKLGYRVTFGTPNGLDLEDCRAETFRSRGVRVLRAPFQNTVQEAILKTAGAYGLVYTTSRAAQILSVGEIRSLTPHAKIVLALSSKNIAGSILDDVDVVDLVMPSTSEAALVKAGKAGKLLHAPSEASYQDRSGIWVLAEGNDPAAQDARQWFVKCIQPSLTKALPGVRIHIAGTTDTNVPSLDRFRLAVAPLQRQGADVTSLRACLHSGVPVLATPAALPEQLPGTLLASTTPDGLARQIIDTYDDAKAWQTLFQAIPPRSTASQPGIFQRLESHHMRLALLQLGLKAKIPTASA
jgi:hypothetical protein